MSVYIFLFKLIFFGAAAVFVYGVIALLVAVASRLVSGALKLFLGPPAHHEHPALEPLTPESSEAEEAEPGQGAYPRNWRSIAQACKERADWSCVRCGVCLADPGVRHLLHAHHCDADPSNNARSNLAALCVACHAEQPGAGHRRLSGAISSDGRRAMILALRRHQRGR